MRFSFVRGLAILPWEMHGFGPQKGGAWELPFCNKILSTPTASLPTPLEARGSSWRSDHGSTVSDFHKGIVSTDIAEESAFQVSGAASRDSVKTRPVPDL
jgi:hypothetical protein